MAKKTDKNTSPESTGEVEKKVDPNQYDLEREANKVSEEQTEAERLAKEQAQAEAERLAKEQAQAEAEAEQLAKYKEIPFNGYTYKGKKYALKYSMPNRVNIDGEIYSKDDILSNTDILESMIDSKNIFIKEM